MKVQYDAEAEACYLEVSACLGARTVHLADGVIVDVDDAGEPVDPAVHKPSSISWSRPRAKAGAGDRASASDLWTATSHSRAWQASNGRSCSCWGATPHSSR